ncbi:MAG: putative Aminopeptidase [Candidatus Saccharibacteria bacterium]|nr:putative Aminopeptidase [Candidatus Saccharibacteria bacterium]
MDMGKSVARLFEQFQPENYKLALAPDREALAFTGTVTVRGKKSGRPSKRITFHQKDLKITSATIIKHDKKGNQEVVVSRINNQNSLDEVRLHSEAMIYPGEYTVTMEFEGKITKPMNGIYPCNFKHDGKDKMLIATQFESHFARDAFPCIDEPEAKATFDLILTTPAGETVLANTPVKTQTAKGALQTTTFETTPRMSVYLLAFVYGEMGYKEAKTKDGVTIRTYATPDNVAFADYGVDAGVRGLEFFAEYFDMPYPLKKLDMVALPDFSAGAMENWGLMTFRESVLLVDPDSSSIETKQVCAVVVCHELTHQWFGNLVTMKWWDDLWLNESFANMMEYRAVDELFPEWNIWEQFVSHETASAKRRDSLSDVQSVHTDVSHPDEISTLFDPSIVYAKGGSLLYMLLHYIGEEAFRTGLRAYFKKHAYGNTQADDLWEALSETSGKDVGNFMYKWLYKPGFPILDIGWQPGSKTISVQQERFLSDPTATSDDKEPWQVPLATTLPLDKSMLTTPSATFTLTKPDADEPLLFNHDGHSYSLPYYRNAEHLQQIVSGIKASQVDTIDRLLLLDNYIMLQRGGMSQTTELLELLRAYADEGSETVWGAIAQSIGEARKLVEGDEPIENKLDTMIEKLVLKTAEQLGWDDQPDDDAQTLRLRGLALSIAASAKTPSIIDEGLRRFAKFKKPSDLSASTRGVVYFIGARYGTDADFQKLLDLYKTTPSADEKDEIASGLTSVKKPEQYEKLLGLLKTDLVRNQDLMHWFAWLLRNRYSRKAAWEWLTANWDWIEEEFRSEKSFGYFARFCGGVFSHPEELKQFQEFFEPKRSIIAMARDIVLAEQEIISRIAWRERNEAAVKAWLAKL